MNGQWWKMDLDELRREYAKLRTRHEWVLTAISNLEDDHESMLYFPPNVDLLTASIEKFIERVDRILEEGP